MPNENLQLWLVDVVAAFRELQDEPGGVVWLQNLYDWIKGHRSPCPKNYAAVTRATIYHHSSDSEAYQPGYPDVFRKVAHGGWALRHPASAVPAKSTDLLYVALSAMSVDELTTLVRSGASLYAELERRADELKQRFRMA